MRYKLEREHPKMPAMTRTEIVTAEVLALSREHREEEVLTTAEEEKLEGFKDLYQL